MDKTFQGEKEQNTAVPRNESKATPELKAAPSLRCVLCKHSNRYVDEISGRCRAAWADFPACGCRCVFTALNPDSLIRAASALYEALRPLADYQYENVAKYTHDGDSRPQVHVSVPVEEIEAARAARALAEGRIPERDAETTTER